MPHKIKQSKYADKHRTKSYSSQNRKKDLQCKNYTLYQIFVQQYRV